MVENPKDPLLAASPDAARELFDRFSRDADGFPREAATGAAVNILINALRQQHATRAAAEKAFDELFGRCKSILVDHYDGQGRKRGVFPYDQTIVMPRFTAPGKAN